MNSYQIIGVLSSIVVAGFIFRFFGKDYLWGFAMCIIGIFLIPASILLNEIVAWMFSFVFIIEECTINQILNLSEGKKCGAISIVVSYGLILGGFVCIISSWVSNNLTKS